MRGNRDFRTDSDLSNSVRTSSSSVPVPHDAQPGLVEDADDLRERVTQLEGCTADLDFRLQVLEAATCKGKKNREHLMPCPWATAAQLGDAWAAPRKTGDSECPQFLRAVNCDPVHDPAHDPAHAVEGIN